MRQTAVISPTIAASTNDWAPTDFAICEVIRASVTGTYNLTGIASPSRGRVIDLYVTAGTLTLINASGLSTAGNRFDIGADQAIAAGGGVKLFYDFTSLTWRSLRIASQSGGASIGVALRLSRYPLR